MSKYISAVGLALCVCFCCNLSVANARQDANYSEDQSADVNVTFENKNQKRQYERVLSQIQSMKPTQGGTAAADDWFVVGSAFGDQVNFETYQGEKNVAIRIAQFTTATRNRGQWRIYARASDSELADEQLATARSNYQSRRQAQYNRLLANEIVRRSQIQNSYRQPYYGGRSFVTGVMVAPGGAIGPVTSSFGINGGFRSGVRFVGG